MDQQLQLLISLQAIDTRIGVLEADAARLPKEIAAIHAAVEEARKQVEQTKTRLDAARKDQRAKEKDLEVVQAKRVKNEARLYEVKTNKEYSAVLIEIEEIKQEKARMEEEVLVLMESQERLSRATRRAWSVRTSRPASSSARARDAARRPRSRSSCAGSRPTSPRCVPSAESWPPSCPRTSWPTTTGSCAPARGWPSCR